MSEILFKLKRTKREKIFSIIGFIIYFVIMIFFIKELIYSKIFYFSLLIISISFFYFFIYRELTLYDDKLIVKNIFITRIFENSSIKYLSFDYTTDNLEIIFIDDNIYKVPIMNNKKINTLIKIFNKKSP